LFTGSRIKLMKDMLKNGGLVRKKQKYYGTYLGFYFTTKLLQDYGLIKCGERTKNNEKVWVLTNKGREFIQRVEGIEKIIGEFD